MTTLPLLTVSPYYVFAPSTLRMPEGGAIEAYGGILAGEIAPSSEVTQTFVAVGHGAFKIKPKASRLTGFFCAAANDSIDISKATPIEAWRYFTANSATMLSLAPDTLKAIVDRMSEGQRKAFLDGKVPWRQLVRGGDHSSAITDHKEYEQLLARVRKVYGVGAPAAAAQPAKGTKLMDAGNIVVATPPRREFVQRPQQAHGVGMTDDPRAADNVIRNLREPLQALLRHGHSDYAFYFHGHNGTIEISRHNHERGIATTVRSQDPDFAVKAVGIFLEHGATYINVRIMDGEISTLADFPGADDKIRARAALFRAGSKPQQSAHAVPITTHGGLPVPGREFLVAQLAQLRTMLEAKLPVSGTRALSHYWFESSSDGSGLTIINLDEERRVASENAGRGKSHFRDSRWKYLNIERAEAKYTEGRETTTLVSEIVARITSGVPRAAKVVIDINPLAKSADEALILAFDEAMERPL